MNGINVNTGLLKKDNMDENGKKLSPKMRWKSGMKK